DYYSKWAASENQELRYIKINGLGDVKDIQKTIFDQIN
ncbi:MAG: adenylate kinase, partial [Pseudomonadota bacterium]